MRVSSAHVVVACRTVPQDGARALVSLDPCKNIVGSIWIPLNLDIYMSYDVEP